MKDTPDKEQLEKNLNSLTERRVNVPDNPLGHLQTAKEIENLRLHIQQGCLSDLPPGCGTEKNEQLHRLLNHSLITGATTISIELAIALLTILFYYHSTKSSALQHKCKSESSSEQHTYEQALNPEVIVAEGISELCTDSVVGSVISVVAFNLLEFMDNVNTLATEPSTLAVSCTYQSFQISFLLMML